MLLERRQPHNGSAECSARIGQFQAKSAGKVWDFLKEPIVQSRQDIALKYTNLDPMGISRPSVSLFDPIYQIYMAASTVMESLKSSLVPLPSHLFYHLTIFPFCYQYVLGYSSWPVSHLFLEIGHDRRPRYQ
jgi:hypothetical protein